MKTVKLSDITLREIGKARAAALSFKERVEIAPDLGPPPGGRHRAAPHPG